MAQDKRVDVGNLALRCRKHKLEAKASTTLIYRLASGTLQLNSARSTTEEVNLQDLWVSRGTGLKIVFELNHEYIPVERDDWAKRMEALGQELVSAELWKQLSLKAERLPAVANDTYNCMVVELILKYDELLPVRGTGRTTHRSTPPQRALPPASVRRVNLQEVRITFDLLHPNKQRPSKKVRSGEDSTDFLEDDMLLESIFMERPSSDSDSMLDDAPLFSQESVISSWPSSPDSENYSNQFKRRNEGFTIDEGPTSASLDQGTLMAFLDAALRLFLYPSSLLRQPGIRVVKKDIPFGLAQLVPAIFSPGYPYAITEQSKYISTITECLVSIGYRCKSDNLKKRFEDMCRKAAEDGQSVRLHIEGHLWLAAQRKLFQVHAARKLESLTCRESATPVDYTEVGLCKGLDDTLDRPGDYVTDEALGHSGAEDTGFEELMDEGVDCAYEQEKVWSDTDSTDRHEDDILEGELEDEYCEQKTYLYGHSLEDSVMLDL